MLTERTMLQIVKEGGTGGGVMGKKKKKGYVGHSVWIK